jgi:arginyl-tRNA synthetase
VVGNEQIYHFQVLSLLLDKLGYKWGKDLYHFSYGMVELPNGRMKSREGTVVDADDLVAGMVDVARAVSMELGKLEGYSEAEKEHIYHIVALGALKYFILKVDPKKTMTFNPEESIDFNGNTGPFIQYTYARIQSILRKASDTGVEVPSLAATESLNDKERNLLKSLSLFPEVVKEFNSFYHDHSILNEPDSAKRDFRLVVAQTVGKVIKNGFSLLGIEVPERM